MLPLTVSLLLLLSSATTLSQTKPTLADEFDGDNCEMLLAILDGFATRLLQSKSKGFVLFKKTSDSIRDNFLHRFLLYHRSTRTRGEPMYEVIPISREGASRFQMWIGAPTLENKAVETHIGYKLDLKDSKESRYFTGELYELFTVKGKPEFSEVGSGCTTRPMNLGLLSQFIDTNPGSKAYFIVRSSRRKFEMLKAHLMREATSQGLKPSKTRFIYAGTRMLNSKQFIEVEVFISLIETKSAASFPYRLGTS